MPAVASPAVVSQGVVPSPSPDQKLTPERATLESKLSPALLAAFDCWKNQGPECKSPKEDRIEIQVFFTDNSTNVVDELKALGFIQSEDHPKQNSVVGVFPTEKLAELAQLKTVRFVALVTKPKS